MGPPFARFTSPPSSLSASTPVKEVVSASGDAWQWCWRLPCPKTVQCATMRSDHPARCLPCASARSLVRADALLRLCACTQMWQIVRLLAGSMNGKRICTGSDVSHFALLDPRWVSAQFQSSGRGGVLRGMLPAFSESLSRIHSIIPTSRQESRTSRFCFCEKMALEPVCFVRLRELHT